MPHLRPLPARQTVQQTIKSACAFYHHIPLLIFYAQTQHGRIARHQNTHPPVSPFSSGRPASPPAAGHGTVKVSPSCITRWSQPDSLRSGSKALPVPGPVTSEPETVIATPVFRAEVHHRPHILPASASEVLRLTQSDSPAGGLTAPHYSPACRGGQQCTTDGRASGAPPFIYPVMMQLICSKDVIVYTRSSARRKVWMKPLSDSAIRYSTAVVLFTTIISHPHLTVIAVHYFSFHRATAAITDKRQYRATTIVVNIRQIRGIIICRFYCLL